MSVKVEATEPSISISNKSKEGTALVNNLISSDDKKKGVDKKASKKDVLKAGKKLSKADINIQGKVEVKAKLKPKLSKEIQLPLKAIKMKELISQKYKDPITEIKEIPRFHIYKPKK